MNIPKALGTPKDLLRRHSKAEERWNLWRSIHQECFDYSAPERENFRYHSPGQRKNRQIFDSTAVIGLGQFASVVQSAMVPPWMQWMDLIAGDEIPEEEKDRVDKALEESTKVFFSALNSSNFSTEVNPSFIDYGIGTGGILIEENGIEDDQIFRFTNVPLSELCLEPSYGRTGVDNVWRKQQVEPRLLLSTWPEARLPDSLLERAKKQDCKPVDIVSGMLKNDEDGRYYQVVFYKESLIFTQSFKTKRLIVFRNTVMPGETYGRGPIMQILSDIRTANKIKEFLLQNAAIQISGVYTGVSDGVFNPYTVRIAPGSVIPVSSNNTSNPSLAAVPISGNIQLGDLLVADLQTNIKKALMVDPLGDVTDPVKSATEQHMRRQENLEQRGASLSRLMTELIKPLVAAGVEILQSRGKIPQFRFNGKEVNIKMQSPLAKAESLEDYQNLQVWLGSLQALPPEIAMASVKMEDIPRYSAEKLGVPASLMREEQERQSIMDGIMQQAGQGVRDAVANG